jgi:hypothetical protein
VLVSYFLVERCAASDLGPTEQDDIEATCCLLPFVDVTDVSLKLCVVGRGRPDIERL